MEHSLRTAVPVLALALLGAACVSSGAREEPGVSERVRPISQAGLACYSKAFEYWSKTMENGLYGRELDQALGVVVDQLGRAQANDPDCPLFRSKRGELALERAQLAEKAGDEELSERLLEQAREELESSVVQCEQWVPGYLALADLYTRCARTALAADEIELARRALQAVEAAAHVSRARIGESDYFGAGPERVAAGDAPPASTAGERFRILSAWLQRDAAWRLDVTALPDVSSDQGVSEGSLRALRARIELQAVLTNAVETHAGADQARDVAHRIEGVLRWDVDSAAARLAHAQWLHRAGDDERALALLQPYVSGRFPLLRNNIELLSRAAQWELARYRAVHDEIVLHDAAHYFARWLQISPEDPDALAGIAAVRVEYARRGEGDPELVASARQALARLPKNDPQASALREQLRAVASYENAEAR